MSADADFDLVAAALRADLNDLDAFVEALATKLEVSFPDAVRIDRKGGLLGGRKRVQRVAVQLGGDSFELERDGGSVICRRRAVVRGIALKTEELELERWLDEVSAALVASADEAGRGRAALEKLLEG